MKKCISWLLCAALLLLLCACAPEQNFPTETSAPTLAEETALPAPTQEDRPSDLVAVVLQPLLEDTYNKAGDTLVCTVQSQLPSVLTASDNAAGQKITAALTEFFAEHEQAAENYRQSALTAEQEGGLYSPYLYSVLLEPARVDSAVISMTGRLTTYSGGAHPNSVSLTCTFSAVTGEVVTLPDVLVKDTFSQFAALVCEKFEQLRQTGVPLFEDYADTVTSQLYSTDENWYFGTDGMDFVFSPYALAPYSAGFLSLEIPYKELQGLLKEDYMPQPRYAGDHADLRCIPPEDRAGSTVAVTIDEAAEPFAVETDTPISDVRLVYYLPGFTEDYREEAVTAAVNRLLPEDLLVISDFIPDVLPNLALRYRMADGTLVSREIFQSGMDGTIYFLEP